MRKTLAMRLLEGKQVPYEVVTYPSSEREAGLVARHIGAHPEEVFKTLVVVREMGKPILAMIPADRKLDLRLLAKAVGEKKVKMATHEEAERLTRLEVGGISALSLVNRGFAVVLDVSARAFDAIYVSAGQKGVNLRVPVEGLIRVTGAECFDVSS